jgi:hypothetical protein
MDFTPLEDREKEQPKAKDIKGDLALLALKLVIALFAGTLINIFLVAGLKNLDVETVKILFFTVPLVLFLALVISEDKGLDGIIGILKIFFSR